MGEGERVKRGKSERMHVLLEYSAMAYDNSAIITARSKERVAGMTVNRANGLTMVPERERERERERESEVHSPAYHWPHLITL